MRPRSVLAGVTAIMFVLLAGLFLAHAADRTRPVVTDLQTPRGLTPLDDGSLLVAEVLGGRLLRMRPTGELTVVQGGLPATFGGPTSTYPTGISAAVRIDGVYYFIVGEFRGEGYSTLYRLAPGGTPQAVAGGIGRDGFPATPIVNPYDLVPAPDGGIFISDGGYNAVLHVTRDGTITKYATFERRENPDAEDVHATIDVVPTGLAYGPDGALYLASLTGIPYPQGAAQVYRLEDVNGDGDAEDEGETTVYAAGFSVATDLAFTSDGALLVTEFSRDMPRLVREYSLDQAHKVPGRLVRWQAGSIDVVAGDLVAPTAVATVDGRILVSEEFAGRVTEIRPLREGPARWLPFAVELLVVTAVVVALGRAWQRTRS